MPKIIENAREALLAEAKRQIEQRGYRDTTVRSVAAGCGIAVGTVYNYFSSKDMLIASFLLEDWFFMIESLKCTPTDDSKEYLRAMYQGLCGFADKYSVLFSDEEAQKSYNSALGDKHALLRSQLSDLIVPVCRCDDVQFASRFAAEAMLTWTMEGCEFERLYDQIIKIII